MYNNINKCRFNRKLIVCVCVCARARACMCVGLSFKHSQKSDTFHRKYMYTPDFYPHLAGVHFKP